MPRLLDIVACWTNPQQQPENNPTMRKKIILLPALAVGFVLSIGMVNATMTTTSSDNSGSNWSSSDNHSVDNTNGGTDQNGGDKSKDTNGGGDCNPPGDHNPPPIPEANAFGPVLALLTAAVTTEVWRRRRAAGCVR
jgi:hypothetical protein